jgi:hypothetical protein
MDRREQLLFSVIWGVAGLCQVATQWKPFLDSCSDGHNTTPLVDVEHAVGVVHPISLNPPLCFHSTGGENMDGYNQIVFSVTVALSH